MKLNALQGLSLASNLLTGTLSKDWLLPATVRGMLALFVEKINICSLWLWA